jgi:hypothetical protein
MQQDLIALRAFRVCLFEDGLGVVEDGVRRIHRMTRRGKGEQGAAV